MEGDEEEERDEEYWDRYAERFTAVLCDEDVYDRMENAKTRAHSLVMATRSRDVGERRKAVEELSDHLRYEHLSLERAALRRLAKRLYELAGDEDLGVRQGSAEGLSVLAGSELVRTKVPRDEMISRLDELTGSEDEEVRRHAVRGLVSVDRIDFLFNHRTSVELVLRFLELAGDRDEEIAAIAVRVLKEVSGRSWEDEGGLRSEIDKHLRGSSE